VTVLNKEKIYPTNNGRKVCLYVAFQKRVNGKIKEIYCGQQSKNSSYIKAYSLEVEHLEKRLEIYRDALMDAKENLASYQESNVEDSTSVTSKNGIKVAPEIEIGEGT